MMKTIFICAAFVAKTLSSEGTCSDFVQGVYKHHSQCTNQHISGALMAGMECAPRPTLMALPWPNRTQYDQMTPTYVSVYRCDGSCSQLRYACLPSKTRKRSIPVLLSRCGISSGTCDKDCSSVEVEEHEECSCSCSLDPGDCPVNQTYRPDLCRCECKDILGREACLDSGQFWDDSTCTCGCTQVKECTPGMKFHQQTCSCVPIGSTPHAKEERIPRSTDDLLSFEMIVILILLSIIFVLLIIVSSLLIRIQTMKKNFRLEKMKLVGLKEDGEEDRVYETRVQKNGDVSLVKKKDNTSSTSSGMVEQSKYSEMMNCSTPSSGFYSEPEKQEMEDLYHTSEAVRQNKYSKVRLDQPASPRAVQRSAYGAPVGEEDIYSGGSIYSQLNTVRQYTPLVQNPCTSPLGCRREYFTAD